MNGLDLFSGYGGITFALQRWIRPLAYCELDRYAQAIILSRIRSGQLPDAPIWDDIETFPTNEFIGKVDIIYGGFPCQDISVAGDGVGLDGKRSGLFFRLHKLVEEIKPRFVFLENVPAIRTRGLREVVDAFTDIRYDCRWTRVSAAEVGAPHLRQRWFLLAFADTASEYVEPKIGSVQETSESRGKQIGGDELQSMGSDVPNTEAEGRRDFEQWFPRRWAEAIFDEGIPFFGLHGESWEMGRRITTDWEIEPNVGRVVDGCQSLTDLKRRFRRASNDHPDGR
jgi:DNA (cytosine-5)-methyltransferase 1